MITSIFKRVEVFQPYNIPIQQLIISQPENKDKESLEEDQEHPQNDTASTSGDYEKEKNLDTKISNTSFKLFKCFLNKKRKNSNLVKCYKCEIEDCENLFETKEELDKHKKLHEKIYKCSKCDLQFMYEKNLQKHFKVHCFLVKRYICPYPGCGKRFTALYNQKIHYRIHTGERPYQCKVCGNNYYDRANYKYHIKTAHKICDKNDIICSHGGVCHEFKSKKQKIMHHNKLEKECRLEKNYIIRLISNYENTLNKIKNEIKDINLEEYEEYQELKKQKEKTEKIASDKDLFQSIYSNKVNINFA
jgi:uncharacterized Zn-finger protein